MRHGILLVSLLIGALAITGCGKSYRSSRAGSRPSSRDDRSAIMPPAQPTDTYRDQTVVFREPAPTPAAVPAGSASFAMSGNRYTVQPGDTLWRIAERTYGTGKKYNDILSANPGLDPHHIKVGQIIAIP